MMAKRGLKPRQLVLFLVLNVIIVACRSLSSDFFGGGAAAFSAGFGMMMAIGSFQSLTLFAIVDKSKMNDNFTLLGIKKHITVICHYIYALFLQVLFAVLSLIIYFLMTFAITGSSPVQNEVDFRELGLTALCAFVLLYIMQIILLPIFFALKYEHAINLQMLPMFGILALMLFLSTQNVFEPLIDWMSTMSLPSLTLIAVGILALLAIISVTISVKLYQKRVSP
jgi:hypothetical protein